MVADADGRSHYQRLGVRPSASTTEVQAAYRSLARQLHPDRQVGASAAEHRLAERRMREVNEAWAVLRDPARRRGYDAQRLAAARASNTARPARPARPPAASDHPARPSSGAEDDDLVDVLPPMGRVAAGLFRHLPWVVLLVVFAAIFVATAYAGGGPSSGTDPRATEQERTCVDVAPGPTTTLVDCDGPHELEVVRRVDEATPCPAGTERRRLGQDGFLDCVVEG
ncbi:MAG: J domain-containing protein [Acidimicrobiales bacterium]|nr:J domain-containing protein [Acidimicrobiales bacterium]